MMLTGEMTGAAIAFFGYASALFLQNRIRKHSPKEVCQCEHVSSMHDMSGCHAQREIDTQWNKYGEAIGHGWQSCACVRYVGPLSSYVPEIDGSDDRKDVSL